METAAAGQEQTAADASSAELIAASWRCGVLRWLLDAHQRVVYDKFKAWEADPPNSVEREALYDSIFVVDIGRRWGKTWLCLLILIEWGLQRDGAILTYATAEKQQIRSIVIPLFRKIVESCPADLRPEYRGSSEGMEQGLYFKNGSIIKLVGVDKDPDRLRGQASDGGCFSEAAHMKDLEESVSGIFLPQFQRRPWARLILESTAPTQPDHDFDRVFIPDAEKRGAYVFGTIDDNHAITADEKEKAIREAGGRDSARCRREYYGIRVRDPERVLVPEFDMERHVVPFVDVPPFAHAYVGVDPGTRDMLGIVWAYWDFERAKLVVQRSYAERNVTTTPVADLIKRTERELWHGQKPAPDHVRRAANDNDLREGSVRYWNGKRYMPNPYIRVSDTDLRLIGDLVREHGISIAPTPKDDAEAQLYSLRNAFLANKIEIVADSGPLAIQLKRGMWNDARTEWERTDALGHLDCVAALIYLWRNVIRTLNPYPPGMPVGSADKIVILPWHTRAEKDTVRALNSVLGQGRQRTRWR